MSLVLVTRRDGARVMVEMNTAEVAHRTDADGIYVGLVAAGPGLVAVPDAPPAGVWRRDFVAGTWTQVLSAAQRLAAAKAARTHDIRIETLVRVQALYSGIDSFAALEVIAGLWTQGLSASAKSPQGDWLSMLQIIAAGRAGIQAVRAAASPQDVAAVTVAWPI